MTLRARIRDVLLPLGVALGLAGAVWVWGAGSGDRGVPVTPVGAGTATSSPTPTPPPGPFGTPLSIPPVITSADANISMEEACVQILPGPCTNLWTYDGIFPGPTIRRPTGQTTNVTFTNNLPVAAGEMTVHHHGNHSSSENDGQPHHHLIPAGESLMYSYEHMEDGGDERGATQWYHDHRMDVTGRNVWNGLAGMYILDDPADTATLPSGAFEVPLIVMDRPSPAMLKDLGLAGPRPPGEEDPADEICGLHTGTAITERSIERTGELPTQIHLFRAGIINTAGGWSQPQADDAVYEEIMVTLLHEIGHHFGLDEEDLADLGYD